MPHSGALRPAFAVLTLLLALLGSAAHAQVSLTLGDTTLNPGDSGSITASIATDGSAVALQFDVLYDPAVLTLGTVNGGPALTGSHSIASNPISPGRDRIVITTAPVTALGAGVLATINLAVLDSAAAGTTPLNWSGVVISDASAQPITPSSLVPGSVTVPGGVSPPPAVNPPPAPEPEAIPTLPIWGLGALISLMLTAVGLFGRRSLKNLLPVVLPALVAVFALTPETLQAQNLPGDANGDGRIDAEDVRLIVERILERGILPGDGDCNRDGTINVLDTVCSQIPFVPGETAPIILGPGDRSIPAEIAFEMNLFAADPDAGATQSWELVSGPAGLAVSADGVLTWIAPAAAAGPNSVSIRVTDDTARTDEASFSINVFLLPPAAAANAPPVLTVPDDQALPVGTPIAAQASAADPDAGDTLTFRLVNGPAGMSIDAATGSLTWTPQADQARTADVVIEVSDAAGAVDFGSFTVTATVPNEAPTAVDDVYIARKGETLLIDAAAGVLRNDNDPDDDSLNATWLSDPTKGTLESFATDGSFSYTVDAPTPITIGLVEKCSSDARVVGGAIAVGDVDQDGVVEIVSIVRNGTGAGSSIFIVDPADCSSEVIDIPESLGQANHEALPILVNLDDDRELEIVTQYQRFNDTVVDAVAGVDERLYAVKLDGTPLDAWVTTNGAFGLSAANSFDVAVNASHRQAAPVAVDLNGDGVPALIMGLTNASVNTTVGNTTRNAVVAYDGRTGAILWEFIGGITRPLNDRAAAPTIVDLDLDGDPEIIWSQHVLDHEGNLLFDLPVEQTISGGGSDFLTVAIANFDNDAYPEIISFDASNITLYSHTGAIQWQRPYNADAAKFPWSDITVAELDGDPFPEFVIVFPSENGTDLTLRAFDSDGQDLWDQAATGYVVKLLDESRNSSPVAIDLDGDGIDELIQLKSDTSTDNDAAGLYIIDGATGDIIDFQPGDSNLRSDQTLTVADVDGDGSADIITNMGAREGRNPIQIWSSLPGEPFADARPFRSGANGQPTWANVDGSLPARIEPHWLQPGRNGWNRIVPDRDPYEPDQDSFTYRASDGALDSNTATVNLEIRPTGNPPFFLSEPRAGTSRGVAYTYTPLVVDLDPDDVVSFELVAGPPGMTLDPESGRLDWNPEALGEFPVSILASDTLGFSSAQIFRLRVGDPVLVPDVIGLTESAAGDTLIAANLQLGERSLRSDPVVPSGEVLEQSPPAGAVADFGSAVRVTVSSGAGAADTDADGDGFTPNQGDCDDSDPSVYPGAPEIDGDGIDQNCNGIDGNKTLVAIEVTPGSKRVLTNQPIPLTATGIFEDGTAQNLTAVASWTRGPTFFSGTAGNVSAEASFLGVTGSADFVVLERVADDVAPVARIDSPEAGAVVTAPTDIVGVVTDSNLLRWELAYQYAGEDDFVTFAEGTNTRNEQPIAEFDPTSLINGLYKIRLQVFDAAGNVTEDSTTVRVEGQMKIGNFTLRYVDLELPLSGIPISLVRSYDSRDKRVGDFGVGWQLGVNSIEVFANRELGSAWRVFRQGLSYGLIETDAHLVGVRLPGGRIETFQMVVSPAVSPIVPFPPFSQSVRFQPLPGTLGSLQALGENNVSILDAQPGPASFRLDSDGSIYNPSLFRYTTPQGLVLDLHVEDGIQRAATASGQVLTFTPTSITHSNGTTIDVQRDAAGRITRITDPGGFTQTYTYDANGDLREHTDQAGFVTRFDYDGQHNLLRITDPLERNVIRNEYDDEGRLISATNGTGDTTTFSHDVAGRQETQTDADGFVTVYDYDEAGNVTRVTDPLGGVSTSTYDPDGNLLSTTNPLGQTTSYNYDDRGNLLSETDPLGANLSYSYDSRDLPVVSTDALGRITRYEYDGSGQLAAEIDPAGNIARSRRRDANGNVVAIENERGAVTRFEYDVRGYQRASVDARGIRTEFTVDANGNTTEIVGGRGGRDQLGRDGRGFIEEVQSPEGNSLSFDFDALGRLRGLSDGAGNATSEVLDAAGRVVRSEVPGGFNQMLYDGRGNRTRLIDATGGETRYEYDALSRLVRTILPAGGIFETSYDAVGRVLTETDPNGNVTSYEYDAAGRNTAVIDALGQRTEFTYDLVGNLTARLDARGNTTRYTYDVLDRLIETEYPDGSTETIDYDPVGNVIAETDRLGRTRSYTYDPNDNLLTVTDIDGGVTTFAYDANNNRSSQTDPNGHTTRMVYDANDRLIEKQYPDGSSERYEYDAGNRIARTILPDGKFIDASYDGFGRPTGYDLNGEATESFTYDGAGRPLSSTNLWGTVSYSYDADGRVTEIASEGGHAVRYTYDDLGNRISVATQLAGQAARITTYTYDALNRLSTMTEPDGDTTTYTYDPVGNVASITYPNGVVSAFSYDNVNQLTRIEHRQGATTLAAYDYTLDAGGRRLRVDHANGDSVSFSYDVADRLLQETHRNASNVVIFEQTFTYDDVGNRLTQQITGQAQTVLAYDSADKLLSAGSTTFAYDANGRLISRTAPQGTVSYAYDVEGQLLRVTTPTGTITYAYDAMGKRRLRVANGSEENFLLDEASLTGYDQTLVAFDENDDPLMEFHWGDRLISADDGSSDRFYHFDASRNTRLLTDEAGAVSDTIDYDAFGNVRSRTGPADSPYGFAGEWQDEAEGLVFLRARYYDPGTGRFISRDPYAGNPYDPVSLHRYLYANANPIMNTDPSGQVTLTEVGISIAISVTISVIADLASGITDPKRIFYNAVLSAGFGALGVGAAGKLGTAVTSKLASGVTRKGVVFAATVTVKAAVTTFFSVVQTADSDFLYGESTLNFGDVVGIFVINIIAEAITGGYYAPKVTSVPVAPTSAGARSALASAAESGSRGAKKLIKRLQPGEDALEFLRKATSIGGKNAGVRAARKSARQLLKQLENEAEEIITFDWVKGTVGLFNTTVAATFWIEYSKKLFEIFWKERPGPNR